MCVRACVRMSMCMEVVGGGERMRARARVHAFGGACALVRGIMNFSIYGCQKISNHLFNISKLF